MLRGRPVRQVTRHSAMRVDWRIIVRTDTVCCDSQRNRWPVSWHAASKDAELGRVVTDQSVDLGMIHDELVKEAGLGLGEGKLAACDRPVIPATSARPVRLPIPGPVPVQVHAVVIDTAV